MTGGFTRRVRRSRLGRLDDRVVPRLQHAAAATARGMGAPFRGAHAFEKSFLGGRPYRFAWRRRRYVRSGLVVLALLGSAVHFQRYPEILDAREAARAAARQQTIRQPDLSVATELSGGAIVHGPPLEGRPELYVEERRGALAALPDGEHVAIVSFSGYLSSEAVRTLLPAGATVLRAQYRIPDVNVRALETEVVGGDLRASIDRIIEDEVALIRDEEGALDALLSSGTMGDPAFEADARARIEELRVVRNVLQATGAIVFAVVVRADVVDLRALDGEASVRLVDPVPGDADLDASILFGLRPEDRTRVTFGVAG